MFSSRSIDIQWFNAITHDVKIPRISLLEMKDADRTTKRNDMSFSGRKKKKDAEMRKLMFKLDIRTISLVVFFEMKNFYWRLRLIKRAIQPDSCKFSPIIAMFAIAIFPEYSADVKAISSNSLSLQ